MPLVGGMFFKDADARLVQDLSRPRAAVPVRAVRAQLPALLALPHAAALLRAAVLVHPHHRDQGRAAGREREDQLVPAERSSTAGTATGCATTSTGRCRGPATGARRCRCGGARTSTSPASARRAELAQLAGQDLSALDPHRPFVDDVTFACPDCGTLARRVPEVIDAWYDSGSMPFARYGAPWQQRGGVRAGVPGRVHLRGDRPDPRLVLLADGGRHAGLRPDLLRERALPRAHPRRGRPQDEQAPGQHPRADPADGAARCGRAALVLGRRGSPWSARRVGHATLEEIVRKVLLTYWNTVSFLALYAKRPRRRQRLGPGPARRGARPGERPVLDRWVLERAAHAGPRRHRAMEDFDTAGDGPADRGLPRRPVQLVRAPVPAPVLGGAGDAGVRAFATLHECLETVTRLMAPITPFITDYVWSALRTPDAPESVHLARWPEADPALHRRGAVRADGAGPAAGRAGPVGPRQRQR